MIVICLEGCHGSGKTALCHQFTEAGFDVLDEGFLDMPDYSLHPQSLLMETSWICAWFQRILKRARSSTSKAPPVIVADRSPYSAILYSRRGGRLLEPLIREHIAEICEEADIHIFTVYVKVEPELLWSRIQERLEREPSRARYNEGNREWMETVLEFYEEFNWDMIVENNTHGLDQLLSTTLQSLIQSCEAETAKELASSSSSDSDEELRASPPRPAILSNALMAAAAAIMPESPTQAIDQRQLDDLVRIPYPAAGSSSMVVPP